MLLSMVVCITVLALEAGVGGKLPEFQDQPEHTHWIKEPISSVIDSSVHPKSKAASNCSSKGPLKEQCKHFFSD